MAVITESSPEIAALAHRIAVGELDGEAATQAVIDALVALEAGTSDDADLRAVVRMEAGQAVAEDPVLTALLRPVTPAWDQPPSRLGTDAPMPVVPVTHDEVPVTVAIPGPPQLAELPRAPVAAAAEDIGYFDPSRGYDLIPDPLAAEVPEDSSASISQEKEPGDPIRQLHRRMLITLLGAALIIGGTVAWWVWMRKSPCDALALQVCRELPDGCETAEVNTHLHAAGTEPRQCQAVRDEVAEIDEGVEDLQRVRLFEQAMVNHLGFDARTGTAPRVDTGTSHQRPVPSTVVEGVPGDSPLVLDEAFVYAVTDVAIVRARNIGGAVETVIMADHPRSLSVSQDFLYWVGLAKNGKDAIWVGRKRGVYDPAMLPTALADLGPLDCIQGACAFVDRNDATVMLVEQDGSLPRKLTPPGMSPPSEVQLGKEEVLWVVPGDPGAIGAVGRDGIDARILAGAEIAPERLRVDEDDACWLANRAVRCVPRTGGEVTEVAVDIDDYALDGARIVVIQGASGTIAEVPRAGGDVTPLAEEENHPRFVVAGAAAIFWNADGVVRRLAKS